MSCIVLLLFFYKDGFGIKYPIKIDVPLNKETKPNYIIFFLFTRILLTRENVQTHLLVMDVVRQVIKASLENLDAERKYSKGKYEHL